VCLPVQDLRVDGNELELLVGHGRKSIPQMILELQAYFMPIEWSFERLAECLTRISDGH